MRSDMTDERQEQPDGPTDLGGSSWRDVLKRTVREFKEDNLTDWAAALTYYGILSIFPMLIVLVSLLGLIGQSATQPLIENLGQVAPGPAQQIFTSAITNLNKSQGAAGVLFVVGLVGALWSASGYVAAFMRASNAIYDVEEGRPIWKTLPTRVLTTLVLLLMLAVVGLVLWLVASAAFAFYVANFSSYNKTYGALGGVIAFLVWLWISNIAILLGAEFNAETERGHAIEAGHPEEREPFIEPRDTRK